LPLFFAATSKGLVDVLDAEIKDLGLKVIEKGMGGVSFDSSWEGCYKANLHLRTATRIIKPVLDFPAYQLDDLYHNTLKHDFTKYIEPNQTFEIDASVRESKIRDQRMVALKIKDAIADQFRDKFGQRPDVNTKNPDLRVMARIVKNQVSLAIDTSGTSLNMRGYRIEAGEAPLRENVAAGLLMMSGWQPDQPLVDPMCGAGTILIEAAMIAKKMAPGLNRKAFGFQRLKGFQKEAWSSLIDEAIEQEVEMRPGILFGSDLDSKVLRAAKANAERAGVKECISFQRLSVTEIKAPPTEPGFVLTNPPYGERLGQEPELQDLYKDLAYSMKNHFKGWKLWMLSGNSELTRSLKLKAERKFPVWNGNINCRLLKYEIK